MAMNIVPDFIRDISTPGDKPFDVLRYWHLSLTHITTAMHDREVTYGVLGLGPGNVAHLRWMARDAAKLLIRLGVDDPAAAFQAEYMRAAQKHPGMTLECDGHTDETRFYALAEEVGEVAAALTYDNANSTGHGADTIAEVTQVGALALTWLTRYQDGENRWAAQT